MSEDLKLLSIPLHPHLLYSSGDVELSEQQG